MRREQKKFETKKKVLPRKSEGVAASTMLGERNKKRKKRSTKESEIGKGKKSRSLAGTQKEMLVG